MTHPLDIFRSQSALTAACTALDDEVDAVNACVAQRTASSQAEIFGLMVGAAIGILIGRFFLSGR